MRTVAGGDTSGTGPLGQSDPLATPPSGTNLSSEIKNLGLSTATRPTCAASSGR